MPFINLETIIKKIFRIISLCPWLINPSIKVNSEIPKEMDTDKTMQNASIILDSIKMIYHMEPESSSPKNIASMDSSMQDN